MEITQRKQKVVRVKKLKGNPTTDDIVGTHGQ